MSDTIIIQCVENFRDKASGLDQPNKFGHYFRRKKFEIARSTASRNYIEEILYDIVVESISYFSIPMVYSHTIKLYL